MSSTSESSLHKRLKQIGAGALVVLSLFYFFLLYQVFFSGWSFFGDGPGDLIILTLLSTIYLFLASMYHFAKKFEVPIMNLILIIGTAIYVYSVPKYIHVIAPENDTRAQELRTYVPRGQRKLPPRTME